MTAEAPPKETETSQQNKPYSIEKIDVSKLTDFEIGLLILERDVSQYRVERIDELLNRIGEAKGFAEAEKKNWDSEKIKWVKSEGTKGLYERYPDKDQKAEATDDYKNMLRDLKEHKGKLTRDGFFYWLFEDAATVGRKKKQ
jgi:hypothetical protein